MPAATEVALLDAIFEAPEEDAPRLVYADWLQQRSDVRGEFIALQVARAHGPAKRGARQREQALLEEHGDAWRNALRAREQGTRFERGFMVAVSADSINDHPAWALVHESSAPPTRPSSPATALRIVTHCSDGQLVKLAKLKQQFAIEDLGWMGPSPDDNDEAIAAFNAIRCLPRLRRVQLSTEQRDVRWLLRAPCAAKLEELEFPAVIRQLGRWREELEPTLLPRFIISSHPYNRRMGSRVGLERDADGKLSRLIVIAPATRDLDDEIRRAIDSLPGGLLTAAHVSVPSTVWKASERARAGLAATLTRHGVPDVVFQKSP
ncbi:MAG: hypothetical protein JWO36_2765 [Myxococcales bacterium]|nr:hypothetical protein [Myxococcales bacterium]